MGGPRTERSLSDHAQKGVDELKAALPKKPLEKVAAAIKALKENPGHFLHKGHPLHVKLSIRDLPTELKGLAVPGETTTVLDSESGQKDKRILDLLNELSAYLNNPTLLDKNYSALTEPEKKRIPADVKTLLDERFSSESNKAISLRTVLNKTIASLTMKYTYMGNEEGIGGIITANHLGVEIPEYKVLFSRSARFNSPEKMRAVLDSAAGQENQKLSKVLAEAPQAMKPLIGKFNNKDALTKEETQQLNSLLRDKGVNLYIDVPQNFTDTETRVPALRMSTNLISAMDSKKGEEKKYWRALIAAHEGLPTDLTFEDSSGRTIHIDTPLLTESSQSSVGGGTLSVGTVATKIQKRAEQLGERLALLQTQMNRLGTSCNFTQKFKEFLKHAELIQKSNISMNADTLEDFLKNLSGAEKAFLDYYIAVKEKNPTHQGAFDKFFTPTTNVLTLEMGDIAFAKLGGLHDHVSCKSGQDRTLSLTALRVAISKCGWPGNPLSLEDEFQYKARFATEFFTTIGTQAKSVVEHARGDGGKLKFNLGELLNEQPVPGALFRYMQSPEGDPARSELLKRMNEKPALREGLKTVKMPAGLFSMIVNPKNIALLDITKSLAKKDLLSSFFTKPQSAGKKTLLALFQNVMDIQALLGELNQTEPEDTDEEKLTDADKEKLKEELQNAKNEIARYVKEAQEIKPSLSSQNKEKRGVTSKTESLKKLFATYANKVSEEVKCFSYNLI